MSEAGRMFALQALSGSWSAPGPSGRIVEVGLLPVAVGVAVQVASWLGLAWQTYEWATEDGDEKLADEPLWFGDRSFFLADLGYINVKARALLTGPRLAAWTLVHAAAVKALEDKAETQLHAAMIIREAGAAWRMYFAEEKLAAEKGEAPPVGSALGQPKPKAKTSAGTVLLALGAVGVGLYFLTRQRGR